MNDLYPFCFKCDSDLTEEEKEFNKTHENKFYPICENCLEKAEKKLTDVINAIKK